MWSHEYVLVVSFMLSCNFMLYLRNLYDCDFIGYFVLILKQFLLSTHDTLTFHNAEWNLVCLII